MSQAPVVPGGYDYPSDLDSSDEDSIMGDQDESDEEEESLSLTPGMCLVCQKRPVYTRNGRAYPTCGLTCAGKYQQGMRYQPPPKSKSSRGANGGASGTTSPPSSPPPPRRPQPPCVMCKKRPSFQDRPTCGVKCAEEMIVKGSPDATMCDYCHRQKKHGTHPQCGTKCMERAKLACLMCHCRPRNGRYHLCGRLCREISTRNTPLLLEAHKGHSTYEMVKDKFTKSWKAGHGAPEIKRIFKIIENEGFLKPYNDYRTRVKNEHFRYHGTKRTCALGQEGSSQTAICASGSCAICSILKTSFKVSLAGHGCFGKGIYSSSDSSKAFGYCGAAGVMMLTKVVLGNSYLIGTSGPHTTVLPAGYDSVVYGGHTGPGNETIVYTDDAIRPVFLITFN